jgi:SAM-dependent methyltransferase
MTDSPETPAAAESSAGRQKRYYDGQAHNAPPIGEDLQARLVCDRQLAYLPPGLYRDKAVLDLCCGEARITQFLAQDGARSCTGLDISMEYMLSGCRRQPQRVYDRWIRGTGLPANCRLVEGDAMDLSAFEAGSLDLVCIFQALHHLPDPRASLAQVRRLLRPGGVLVISDPNAAQVLRRAANVIGRRVGYVSDDEWPLSGAEVARMLGEAGFEVQRQQAFNLLSEINYLLAAVISYRQLSLARLLLGANRLLRPLDDLLERTLLRRLPRLGWRFLIVATPTRSAPAR